MGVTRPTPPGRYPSPLRYPGGKGKVANYIKILMIENDLLGVEYVEPYAGGASVALSLLFEDYASHVYINDINPGLFAFWHSLLYSTAEFTRRIDRTPLTVKEWMKQREVQESQDPDPIDLGFSTFYLNRTNRSGIISGGLIGGLDQTGSWGIDARFNRPELVRRVEKVARFRSRITLSQDDAIAFLAPWTGESEEDAALIYLDPPYYVKGEGLYDNFYGHDDHVKVANSVGRLTHPWIVSYDDVPEIGAIYEGHPKISYSLRYSAAGRHAGSEVMFFADELAIPTSGPAGIPVKKVDEARNHARAIC